MKIENALVVLLLGKDLSENASRGVFRGFFDQKLSKPQAKSLLLLLAAKGETAPEVSGCLDALRSLERPTRTSIPGLMDTCGTGGDGSQSLNVSTLSALIIAGAGGRVAKHGNRALSSKSGSSDLMEAFGVNLAAPRVKMLESIRRFGIGYFHAPFHHPVFSRVQPLRRELKTRTIFNLLGPLANPLKIESQLVGVSKKKDIPLYAKVLQRQKIRRALICHSSDGMDEISPSASTDIAWLDRGRIRYGRIQPARYGFRKNPRSAFRGGSARHNAALSLAILQKGLKGPLRDLVIINSAAGLVVAGKASNLRQGIRLAEKSLNSGRAYQALLGLKRLSRSR